MGDYELIESSPKVASHGTCRARWACHWRATALVVRVLIVARDGAGEACDSKAPAAKIGGFPNFRALGVPTFWEHIISYLTTWLHTRGHTSQGLFGLLSVEAWLWFNKTFANKLPISSCHLNCVFCITGLNYQRAVELSLPHLSFPITSWDRDYPAGNWLLRKTQRELVAQVRNDC